MTYRPNLRHTTNRDLEELVNRQLLQDFNRLKDSTQIGIRVSRANAEFKSGGYFNRVIIIFNFFYAPQEADIRRLKELKAKLFKLGKHHDKMASGTLRQSMSGGSVQKSTKGVGK